MPCLTPCRDAHELDKTFANSAPVSLLLDVEREPHTAGLTTIQHHTTHVQFRAVAPDLFLPCDPSRGHVLNSPLSADVQLLDMPNVTDIFPSDAVAKAKKYLDAIGTTGAYSESNGATVFREEIAAALKVRARCASWPSRCLTD